MVDRVETKAFTNKIDLHLQTLITSPYAQQQLKLAGLINHRGQIISSNDYLRSLLLRKRPRRDHEALAQDIVLQTLKIDQNSRRGRRHQIDVVARRALNSNFEFLSRPARKQSYGRKKLRDKSAPGQLSKLEDNNENISRVRVTSANKRLTKVNRNSPESPTEQNRFETLNKSQVFSVERQTCNLTMTYGLKTARHNKQAVRDEIVVMQQHTTGENSVVYKGFLAEGESFSFKSERRPASPLSLAFYAKGFIDSVVNDCCEFKYGRRHQHIDDHSKFFVEQVQKASFCENCRKKYVQRSLTPNTDNISPETTQNEISKSLLETLLSPGSEVTAVNQEQNSTEQLDLTIKEHNGTEKPKRYKKHNVINRINETENKDKQVTNGEKNKPISVDVSFEPQSIRQKATSVDFSLLEYTLLQEREPPKPKLSRKIGYKSILKGSTNKNTNQPISREKTVSASLQGKQVMQAWVDDTDVVPWDPHPSPDGTSLIDADTLSQTSIIHLQQQSQKSPHQSKSVLNMRLENSVESFIYILDGKIQMSNKDKIKLSGLINFGRIFNDINDKSCTDFISEINHEQIIIILSSNSMENLDIHVRDAAQIHSIYVINNGKSYMNDFEKIRGILPDMNTLWDKLETDLVLFANNMNYILSIPASHKTNEKMFVYPQILNEIVLENDESIDLKKEMLDFCHQVYSGNKSQLKFIDEFEHSFQPEKAVDWYLRQDTFLYKMLIRAFRTPEPDILFKLRFFIQHLDRQIKMKSSKNVLIAYRIQQIPNNVFDLVLKNQGGFLTFNQYLLTYKTKKAAKQNSTQLSLNHSNFKLILFEMELDATIPKIDKGSPHNQILISATTSFRISNIEHINKSMPIIKLLSNNQVSNSLYGITNNLREATRESCPLVRMIKLMQHMEYLEYVEYFSLILLNDSKIINNKMTNLFLGEVFHELSTFYYEKERYDRALEHLKMSLEVYLRVLPPNDDKLAPTYNNIGSIYHRQELEEQALEYHKKAYEIQKNSATYDFDSIALYAANIASVLVKQKKYSEAIPFLQHDLQIQKDFHPNDDGINLAVKYHDLAGAQYKAKKYSEALKNYEECLIIELKIYPKDFSGVAITYYNMSVTLEALGKLQEAMETIRTAIERLLLAKDTNDDELKTYKEYETRLQHKLSLKALHGSV